MTVRRLSVPLATVGVIVAAVAVLVALTAPGSQSATPRVRQFKFGPGPVRSVNVRLAEKQAAAMRSHFGILRKSAGAADAEGLPPSFVQVATPFVARNGMVLSAARKAVGLPNAGAWMIPTTSGLTCLTHASTPTAAPAGWTCVADADAEQGGLVTRAVDPASGTETVTGFAPDGVQQVVVTLASGDTQTVAVYDNAYSVVLHATPVSESYTDATGQTVTVDL